MMVFLKFRHGMLFRIFQRHLAVAGRLLCLLSLLFLAACGGGYAPSSTVSVFVSAEFEKRTIGPMGLSAPSLLPARHCWVEGVDPLSGYVYFSGFLNSAGRGIAELPRGASFQVRLYARYEVPGANNFGDFRMRGSVKNGPMQPSYRDVAAFNEIPDWSILSEVFIAQDDASAKVRALDSGPARGAGAFGVADQAIEFALRMAQLEPGLGLPNLHSFWSPDVQFTDCPRAAFDGQHQVLSQATGRTVFQHGVMGRGNPATGGRGDECNDSALMGAFAHLLFADYSYPPVGPKSPYDRLARRDSEDIALAERQGASESTTAFVSGFCDFISAAFRNSPILTEILADGVSAYSLALPTAFSKPQGGEFYRQSVACALYRIWDSSFSGSQSGLQTMWDATYQPGMAKGASGKYPHGYLQCPIGNISSYLSGLANGERFGVSPAVWNSVLGVLGSESISNPTASVFSGGKFWKKTKQPPATEVGSIRAYPEPDGMLWGIDQARHFHFVQTKKAERRIALEMTGGQDLFLELFDSVGMLAESSEYSNPPTKREIAATLKKGEYLVRVRAGYTTQDKVAAFRLVIQ